MMKLQQQTQFLSTPPIYLKLALFPLLTLLLPPFLLAKVHLNANTLALKHTSLNTFLASYRDSQISLFRIFLSTLSLLAMHLLTHYLSLFRHPTVLHHHPHSSPSFQHRPECYHPESPVFYPLSQNLVPEAMPLWFRATDGESTVSSSRCSGLVRHRWRRSSRSYEWTTRM